MSNMYAGRKRRKPVQKSAKQLSAEVVKSNPSKRHRDRLNSELDRLASLLPFPDQVTSSLDKLSILRLSVSYLRTKNFFSVALKTHACKGLTANSGNHDNIKTTGLVDGWMPEGELLLQALNGFVLVITAEGVIFYSSHTIQDYLGFHQTDVMHQSVFELIHTEDQQEFRRNLHWALNPPAVAQPKDAPPDGPAAVTYDPAQLPPENSSFLERSFVCRFRCLLDNSSGFLALSLQGRLKFLLGQNHRLDDGCNVPPQLALFAIATPLQPPSILEIRTKNMIFRTKHKLDFTPMACDAKGKIVLGYTEAELRVRGSGYQFIHAADMLYCAENHVRMIKTGESGLTVFRLLTKENRWKWVQANARLVYKNGKSDYIIATQRPLVEEEGGEHLRKRSMHLPFTFATGEALLYQSSYPIHGFSDSVQSKGKSSKPKKGKLDKNSKDNNLDPSSLLGALMRQDESVYVCQPAVEPKMSFHSSLFSEQQGDSGSSTAGLGRQSWDAVPNGVADSKSDELSGSVDPLLATLDSLSLEGDETCSNSELFSALENLGLNAEDLELLLLDERMIRVEMMDPDYIPSLNDLLTNNEILSYIHDSLESRTAEEGQGGSSCVSVPPPPPHPPAFAPDPHSQANLPPVPPQPTVPPQVPGQRPLKHPPIVQLSQQMQQHLDAALTGHHRKADSWPPRSQAEEVPTPNQSDMLTGVHNGHWGSKIDLDNHCRQQQQQKQPLLNGKASQLGPHKHHHQNPQHPQQHHHQQQQLEQQQWQQQSQVLDQLQSQCHFKQRGDSSNSTLNGAHSHSSALQWQGCSYQDQTGVTANGVCLNGHSAALSVSQTGRRVAHVDYSTADTPNAGVAMNRVSVGDVGQYQGVVTAAPPSYPLGYQRQQQQQPQGQSKGFPQYASHNSSLEQIMGLSQPQSTMPPLDAYGMSDTSASPDATCSKLENGCILNNTSVAYAGRGLLPNEEGSTPMDSPHPCTDTLPNLCDPQTTGYYL